MGVKKIIRKAIKTFWGIDGISLFVKKKKKAIMRRVYTKKYSADDLLAEMCKMGMKNGSVVFIHSSMTEFYNYTGTAVELIDKIIEVIGKEGTLMMPAYPNSKKALFKTALETDEVVFEVNNTPSGAGYLTEVFRKYKGVSRSINLQHSVCVYGKSANYFVNEHHLSEVAWDEFSPYFKLGQINGLIFSLGLESYLRNTTIIHCTESALRHTYKYFASFFGENISYKYLDKNNNVGVHEIIVPIKGAVRSKAVIKKHFDLSRFKRSKISNLNIEMVESRYMFKRCIELAEKGISIYSQPSTVGFIENGLFINKNEVHN